MKGRTSGQHYSGQGHRRDATVICSKISALQCHPERSESMGG